MEFDEVNKVANDGHDTIAPHLASSLAFYPSLQEQNQRHVEALAIGPFYPDYPHPFSKPSAVHRHEPPQRPNPPLTAKIAHSVRRRLKKAGNSKSNKIPIDVGSTSDEDDPELLKKLPLQTSHGRLLSRLTRSAHRSGQNSSASEDQGSESSTDMEDSGSSRKTQRKLRSRKIRKSKLDQSVTLDLTTKKLETPPIKRRRRTLFHRSKEAHGKQANMKSSENKGTCSPKAEDLQVIKDEIQSFDIPSDWASIQWEQQSILANHIPETKNITWDMLFDDLVKGIGQYQRKLESEKLKIKLNQQDIEDYVEKLKQLDDSVEKLNAKIVSVRAESIKRMEHIIATTSKRTPLLKNANARHLKTMHNIEGFHKSMNYAVRLRELQSKVDTARQRQEFWSSIHRWTLPAILITFSGLVGLVFSLLCPLV